MTDLSQAPQFDTGPLGWVMGEIREAFGKSGAALNDATALTEDAQADSLKHAKAYLHQAHGALQMVDVDGVGAVSIMGDRPREIHIVVDILFVAIAIADDHYVISKSTNRGH